VLEGLWHAGTRPGRPSNRVQIIVNGDAGAGGNGGGVVNDVGARQAANERERMQAIYSQLTAIRRWQEAQTTILESLEIQRARRDRAILANLRRIAMQPIVRNVAPPEEAEEEAGNNNAQITITATLSANPRSPHVLWEECETGIGGRRAARLLLGRKGVE
jgi:hypothetical protein